jgi:phage shock protein PspC (stress-responsive transcriptional regulator)
MPHIDPDLVTLLVVIFLVLGSIWFALGIWRH